MGTKAARSLLGSYPWAIADRSRIGVAGMDQATTTADRCSRPARDNGVGCGGVRGRVFRGDLPVLHPSLGRSTWGGGKRRLGYVRRAVASGICRGPHRSHSARRMGRRSIRGNETVRALSAGIRGDWRDRANTDRAVHAECFFHSDTGVGSIAILAELYFWLQNFLVSMQSITSLPSTIVLHYTDRMFKRFFKVLALALLLVLPIQGIAAALGPVLCASSDGHHSMAMDGHSHADEGAPHSHDTNDGPAADEGVSTHLCCHHFSAGVPTVFEDFPELSPTRVSRSIILSHTLFVPEQPQRPPRAVLA